MNVRGALFGIALAFCAAMPASAQDTREPAAAPQASQLSAEHIAAGENLFRAIVFDGGALNRIFEVLEAEMRPDYAKTSWRRQSTATPRPNAAKP